MRTADLDKLKRAGYSIIRPFDNGTRPIIELYSGNQKWEHLAEYPTMEKRDAAIDEMLYNDYIILD